MKFFPAIVFLAVFSAGPAFPQDSYLDYGADEKIPVVAENFRNNMKQWWMGDTDTAYARVAGGVYELANKVNGYNWWSYNTFDMDTGRDFEIEAEIRLVEGGDDNFFGIYFNQRPETGKESAFVVTQSNLSLIYEDQPGRDRRFIKEAGWQTALISVRKFDFNTFTIRKAGNRFHYFLNGDSVAVEDIVDRPSAKIGFIIWSAARVHARSLTVSYLEKRPRAAAAEVKSPAAALPAGNDKFALVVGNSDYSELGRLRNPANDARDVSEALKRAGYAVDLLVDADLSAMEDRLIALARRLQTNPDALGVFFFAGHGVQSSGVNYLVPARADIRSESFLRTKALSVDVVLAELKSSGNKYNLVILDACRDNPFAWSRGGSRGLQVVGNQPPGTTIAFATSAGSAAQDGAGRNGVYTEELLKYLGRRDIDVSEILRLTSKAVVEKTRGAQVPAVYNQYFEKVRIDNSR